MQLLPVESSALKPRLPGKFFLTLRRNGVAPTRFALLASVAKQRLSLFERANGEGDYLFCRTYVTSTSRFGIGQVMHSNRTPLGLHRIARKAGGGWPIGTAFKARQPIGTTWQGMPTAEITHRILWLEGLEPGFNRGGEVDTFRRYIYIHGFGDETTLGRPMSCGCLHLAAADLMPLYEKLPVGTLVWIGER